MTENTDITISGSMDKGEEQWLRAASFEGIQIGILETKSFDYGTALQIVIWLRPVFKKAGEILLEKAYDTALRGFRRVFKKLKEKREHIGIVVRFHVEHDGQSYNVQINVPEDSDIETHIKFVDGNFETMTKISKSENGSSSFLFDREGNLLTL